MKKKTRSPTRPVASPKLIAVPMNSVLPLLGGIFQELTFRCQQKWGLAANVSMVLGHLHLHPEVCEPAAIAEAKRLPRQTMTFVLDTLEKQGLARRKPHAFDRRRKVVQLTPKGKQLAEETILDFLRIEAAALAAIGQANLVIAQNLLRSFSDAISTQNARDFGTVKG
jgi:DNA-binding MarR family transcriptional regulator